MLEARSSATQESPLLAVWSPTLTVTQAWGVILLHLKPLPPLALFRGIVFSCASVPWATDLYTVKVEEGVHKEPWHSSSLTLVLIQQARPDKSSVFCRLSVSGSKQTSFPPSQNNGSCHSDIHFPKCHYIPIWNLHFMHKWEAGIGRGAPCWM